MTRTGNFQRRHPGECSREHERRRARAARAARPKPERGPRRPPRHGDRTCRFCGETFEAKAANSTVCYAAVCQRANLAEQQRAFQRAYAEKHGITYAHARYPEARRAAFQARRALERGASDAVPIVKREVYERDGWVCGICGDPIDPALRFPDPGSATLDHRRPLSRGGSHTLDNVQAAHLTCNASKGARTEG